MQPHAIYFDFIQCEDRFAGLYLDLSIRFCDQSELSWFWIEMAMEGKQRAGLLHYCLEQNVFAADLPDPLTIRTLGEQADELAQRALDPELSIDDAFEIAGTIETSGIEKILSSLTMPIQGPLRVMQKKQELCRNHTGKLKIAATRFAVSPAVQARLAQLS